MSKVKLIVVFAALFISSTAFTWYNYSWKIAKGYSVKFSTESAEGSFESVSGTINFDEQDLATSGFNVKIDVASIATGNFLKTKHAKGESWLNAEKYPTINFVSSKISKTNVGYLVAGNLTLHGVTHSVEIPFTFLNNSFKGNFSVNRADYQVGSVEGMSKKVGNKIALEVSVPVSK